MPRARHDADAWAGVDLQARLQSMTPLPVTFAKDTAAACVAELSTGGGRAFDTHLYVFVDTLTGGGLVIDGQPHAGRHGNAGAIGSMPLARAQGGHAPDQLLEDASLVTLERMLAGAGLPETALTDPDALESPSAGVVRAWIARAADAIAFALCGASCVLDLDGVIVDGALPRRVLAALVEAVRAAMARYDWQGTHAPRVAQGQVGEHAKVWGAACLPLHHAFAPAHELFLKAAP